MEPQQFLESRPPTNFHYKWYIFIQQHYMVVNEWNGLSEEIIKSKSLAGFKKKDWLSSRIHQGIYRSSILSFFPLIR